MRPTFVVSAAGVAGITEYRLILVDCDDATRSKRLVVDRGSPELANATMMDWANHLREEARRLPCRILDTTRASLVSCVDEAWRQFGSAAAP